MKHKGILLKRQLHRPDGKFSKDVTAFCYLVFYPGVERLRLIRGIEWSYNFSSARKILPLLDLLAKFRRVLACSCSQNFAIARMLGFSLTLLNFLKFRKSCKTGYVRTEDTSIVNSSELQFYRRGEGKQHQVNLSFKNSLGFGK